LAQFAHQARAAWPAFARDIERASGTSVDFRACGTLIVAETEAAAARLKARADSASAEWLEPRVAVAREPMLSPSILGALSVPGDAQVDNRALGIALAEAARCAGAALRENCAIRSLAFDGGRVTGVATTGGVVAADAVILALGAWMNIVGGDNVPRITPTKGQMAALEPPPGASMPRALVWSDEVYIVPRERRVLLGATVEDAGFDLSATREARDRLVSAAVRAIPSFADWRVAESWAGLRPRSEDDAPVLGETAIRGLYVAGGQFRNGILFAPLVADRMAAIVQGRAAEPHFDPRRFK